MMVVLAFGFCCVGVFALFMAIQQDDSRECMAASMFALACFAIGAIAFAVDAKDDIIAAIERRPVSAESAR